MKKIGIIVILLAVGVLGFWLYFFPTYSWHQKMTVEVEIDGQAYTGSSVVEMIVKGIREPMQLDNVARHLSMRGEAVAVELPHNQYVFALLTYNAYLTGKVFHDIVGGVVSQPEKGWAGVIGDVQEVRALDQEDYPMLVTFTDINDPKTVKKVDPKNLAATFGTGVFLKRITLEITNKPVTKGRVESVLQWYYKVERLIPKSEMPFLKKNLTPDQRIRLGDFMDWRSRKENKSK